VGVVHWARVDADGLASGVYLYSLNVRPDNAGVGSRSVESRSVRSRNIESGSSLTKRLVLVKSPRLPFRQHETAGRGAPSGRSAQY
jgi:hypothetical protein